jgi:hypothetical protein
MGRLVRPLLQIAAIAVNFIPGLGQLASFAISTALLAGAALLGGPRGPRRAAAAAQLQLGEQPRQAIVGRSAVAGSLVDAFNYGGKYGTDWEVLVIALADHRCDALEGFYVDDTYHAFTGDGMVAGFSNQLQVFWRSGTWDQTVPSILTTNGPGWTANDRGRGVAYVVVAYKSDDEKDKSPTWPSGRPRFRWVVRGLRCYQARKDSTVGGSGAHRRDNPATWEWTENPIDIRYNWVRGIYAGDRVAEPGMLLVGRGLSAIEAPPANVFARANLCDEVVGGAARYRVGGVIASTEPFIDVESDFAAAVGGVISQPEGAVEVDPGEAKAPVANFTDGDLLVGSKVKWSDFLGQDDDGWVNTVVATFVDPAQRWTERSAPVRRDLADIVADGAPREQRISLQLVPYGAQAQRVAEIFRRFGRLWGRGQITLPPRFAFIEEGDWVTWQSNRYFGGETRTFRVEGWGSDEGWRHQLTLRQISASVFSDTAPLDDGSIASTQTPPPAVAAPDVGVWSAAAVLLGGGSVRIPNLRITGASDDPAADFVVFEYVQQTATPDAGTVWTFAASSRPDVTLFDIPVPEGGTFWVAVSYVVDGIQGTRRVLGPISTSGLSFSDGSPVAPVAPANANRVPFSRFEGGRGWSAGGAPGGTGLPFPNEFDGYSFIVAQPVFTAAGQDHFLFTNPGFPVVPNERLSISTYLEVFEISGPTPTSWLLYIEYRDASNNSIGNTPIATASGFVFGTYSGFATVPAAARRAVLVLSARSSGAGNVQMALRQPMVTSAAAGQTTHPPYSPGPNAVDGALPNDLITIGGDGLISGIGTGGINVDNRRAALQGLASARPASGQFIGQEYHATDTREISQWDGFNWRTSADITATAQRTIEPQFPVIEIKQGEAGHTGNRTVTHVAKRGTATLTGGTWTLPSQNLGAGSASINSSTGTVTLSGIVQSGSYTVRYTHTDGFVTEITVNVSYVPTPPSGVVSAKTAATTSNTGVGNTNAWSQVIALTITGAPTGRLFFNNFGFTGGNRISPSTGTGTCTHQARLLINGSVAATAPAQDTFIGGVLQFADFSALFQDAWPVSGGTITVSVELQRTSGTGTISTMSNSLDVTIIAS